MTITSKRKRYLCLNPGIKEMYHYKFHHRNVEQQQFPPVCESLLNSPSSLYLETVGLFLVLSFKSTRSSFYPRVCQSCWRAVICSEAEASTLSLHICAKIRWATQLEPCVRLGLVINFFSLFTWCHSGTYSKPKYPRLPKPGTILPFCLLVSLSEHYIL